MKRFLILLFALAVIFLVACSAPVDSDVDSNRDNDTSSVVDNESNTDLNNGESDLNTDSDDDLNLDVDSDIDSDTDLEIDSDTDLDFESDIDSDIESDDSSDTDTEADSDTDIDTDIDTDTDSDKDSDEESEEEEPSDEEPGDKEPEEEEPEDDEIVEVELKEYGNFTTLHETVESYDRNKQMNNSKASYNTGSSLSSSDLDSIAKKAKLIASFPTNLVYPNGSKFMAHYLAGTGENYNLDVATFVKDSVAKTNRDNDITEAMRAVEQICPNGEDVVIYRKEENIHHNLTGDWKFSVGSYFTAVKVDSIAKIGDVYTATFTYSIIDYYNWNPNDTNKVAEVISPAELYQLHKDGRAQEFLTYGEITYRLTWVEGANASSAIND